MIYIFAKLVLAPIYWLLCQPVVYGRENLRVKGKAIFVANHLSMLDPFLLGVVSPRIIHFMAKKEIFENKFLNFFFRNLYAFPVNRKGMDISSLKNALALLEEGKVFGIFPEGTRSVSLEPDEIERGTAFLASRSAAPVIPIYIDSKSYNRFHPIVMVGKAIDVEKIMAETPKNALLDVINARILNSLMCLKAELETKR